MDTLAHDRPKCERFGAWIMRNYGAPERDLGTNEDVFPAKPGSDFADAALDVTRGRTIFSFRSLQSRWIVANDHNGLT